MGIVVTLAMLLGLIVLRPTPWRGHTPERQELRMITFTVTMLVALGLWNFLWYGLRHLTDFWGWAAIISGISMLLAAVIIFVERSNPLSLAESWLGAMRSVVIAVLALSFLLYAVTLVQINMGMSTLG